MTDSARIVGYTQCDDTSCRLEFIRDMVDFGKPFLVALDYTGTKAPTIYWKEPSGDSSSPLKMKELQPGRLQGAIPAGRQPYAIIINKESEVVIKKLCLDYSPSNVNVQEKVNMNPKMAAPRMARDPKATSQADLTPNQATIATPGMTAVFQLKPALRLNSLYVREIDAQVLRFPKQNPLFNLKLKNGRILSAQDSRILKVTKLPNGFQATLGFDQTPVQLNFRACHRQNQLVLELDMLNQTPENQEVIVAFPCLDGLALDGNGESDYYLFPWGGGVIADKQSRLRTIYGDNNAWWQMVDLFSPTRGGGFYLRIDDSTGIYKGMNLRKGDDIPFEYTVRYTEYPARGNSELMLPDVLPDAQGIGVAVDYQRFDCPQGKVISLPPVILDSHAGNWKKAMQAYAAWAHRTWKFRPRTSKLTGRWNHPAGWGVSCPGSDGRGGYHRRYIKPEFKGQVIELFAYWTVSEKAPWDVPMDKAGEVLGRRISNDIKRHSGFYKDPVTGKMVYSMNRGDYGYSGYNPQWGGLKTFRKHIQEIKDNDEVATFYTDPILACHTTNFGKKYGAKWGVVNPKWSDPFKCPMNPPDLLKKGHVFHYFSYVMCLNISEHMDWIAKAMAKLVNDTGADGIRLDEYGYGGYICVSKEHEHLYPGREWNVWMQAQRESVRRIRQEMDKTRPDAVILTEHIGNDFLASQLDGALCYDSCKRINSLRPLPVNIFRFYFPECKIFDLTQGHGKRLIPPPDLWMFNAVGVYNSGLHSSERLAILDKYKHVFEGECEPFVDTLVPRVYANRFTDGKQIIYTLFNQNLATVAKPVLKLPKAPTGMHWVNLLDGEKNLKFTEQAGSILPEIEFLPGKLYCIGLVNR